MSSQTDEATGSYCCVMELRGGEVIMRGLDTNATWGTVTLIK